MMSTPRRLVVPLLVAALALALIALDRTAPNAKPCASADKAETAGLHQQAQKAYTAVLVEHPGARCAQSGLLTTIRARCAAIGDLVGQGATEDARKAYISLLAADLPAAGTRTARVAAMFEAECVQQGMAITSITKAAAQ
jgi:hypothetical protein